MTIKKRKVVVTTTTKKKIKPTSSRKKTGSKQQTNLIFGKKNFKLILIGIGLIGIGMWLMAGGAMPGPDVWDESLIYSHRRITLAPIVILSGLAIQFFAIFK